MKNENHMIISIDDKKSDKIQHPFMTKTLSQVELEGTYLNMVKAKYHKPTASIIPLKIRNKTGMSAFTSLIQPNIGSPSHSLQTRRINNRLIFR